MFWDNFYNICIENGTTPNGVGKLLGIKTATITNWKQRGNTPKGDVLNMIAEHFGVSVDYLLGNEKKPTPKDELISEISDTINGLNDEEKLKFVTLLQNPDKLRALLSLL